MAKKKKTATDEPRQEVATPNPQLDYAVPDIGQTMEMGSQVTAAWTNLLALATAQGASRRDLVLMTLATAHGIIKTTGENLWPRDTELPPDELHGFGVYQSAYHATGQAMEALGGVGQGQ